MLKPIAIDLGKAYWVIARTDDNNQPTVAGLGEGGLISPIISEFQEQLVVGEQLEYGDDVPILRDCYRWSLGDAMSRQELGQRLRDGANGDVEIFLGGEWWSTRSLLSRLFADLTKVVKDYLAPTSDLPVVAAVPPSIDLRILQTFRLAMQDAGLSLTGWCPTPLALAYGDAELLQREHAVVATLNVDWGFLTFGIVEVRDGFPQLRVAQNLEWPLAVWGQQLPLEQVGELVDRVLLATQEYWGIEPHQVERLLIGGEESWIHVLYPLLQAKIAGDFVPFHQPRLAIAMGTSLFAQLLQEGLLLAPVLSPTHSTEISLTGFALPEAQIEVRGGAQDEAFSVGLTGVVDRSVSLVPEQLNQLSIAVRAPDGRHFAMFLPVEHRSEILEPLYQSSELRSYAASESSEFASVQQVDRNPPEASAEVILPMSLGLSKGEEAVLELQKEKRADVAVSLRKGDGEEVGESTHEDLEIPDEVADAPPRPVSTGFVPKSSPSSSFDRVSVVAEEEDAEHIFSSIGEGDGETRILTQDSYAHLVGGVPRSVGVAEAMAAGKLAEVEEVEVSIEDHDIVEVVEDAAVEKSASLSQQDLDEAEIDEVIDVLEVEPGASAPQEPQNPGAALAASLLARPKSSPSVDVSSVVASVKGLERKEAVREPVLSAKEVDIRESEPVVVEHKAIPLPERREVLSETAGLRDVGGSSDHISASNKVPEMSSVVVPNVPAESKKSVLESLRGSGGVSEKLSEISGRLKKEENVPVAVVPTRGDVSTLAPEQLLEKLMQARQMAREARSLMEESRLMLGELELQMGPQIYALVGGDDEGESDEDPLDLSVRREARKILELGKQLAEVEANRLPTSNRKTLLRLTKELDAEMQQEEGRVPVRLILQLANRLFETIRRDLRPW